MTTITAILIAGGVAAVILVACIMSVRREHVDDMNNGTAETLRAVALTWGAIANNTAHPLYEPLFGNFDQAEINAVRTFIAGCNLSGDDEAEFEKTFNQINDTLL